MIVSHKDDIQAVRIEGPQVSDVLKKVLVSPREGWDGYVMRVFELGYGGYSPRHSHDWPHINYIIKGEGTLYLDGKDYEIKEGAFAYVPGGKMHQFMNTGKEKLEFICIVPEEGEK